MFHKEWVKALFCLLVLSGMGFFGTAHGSGGEGGGRRRGGYKNALLPKTSHTYPTIMKLGTVISYLKKFQKLFESRDTPLDFCWNHYFLTGNQQILLYQERKYRFWDFFWVFKDFFNKYGYN